MQTRECGGTTLYLHVWEWPANRKIILPDIEQTARSGRLLAGDTAVTSIVTPKGLVVALPGSALGQWRYLPPAPAAIVAIVNPKNIEWGHDG